MEEHQYKELVMPTTAPTVSDHPNDVDNTAVDNQASEDKRRSRRNRTLIAAEIRFNDNFAPVKCVIRNLSDTGALLKITDTIAVPNCFTLKIPMQGYEVDSRIVSHAARQISVEFTSEKRQLKSKKVQIIESTSKLDDRAGTSLHAEKHQRSDREKASQNTKNLISDFRRRKLQTG